MEIEVLSVERRLIDLEITRVHDDADRRLDRQRDTVGHAVRDANELDRERADADGLPRPDRLQAILEVDLVLFELRLDQRKGEGGSIDRAVDEREDVRHAPDVVLVAVGQHECLDLAAPLFEPTEVGDDQVHPELVGVGKHDAGVDDNRGVAPRQRHHVHAELAEAAERDNFERPGRHRRHSGLMHQDPSI
jgi:hypothetical protein